MAKANWCIRKDQDLVLDRLLYGGNVCDRCNRQCTTMGGRLIVGKDTYSIVETKNLPKVMHHHCVSCNKHSGKVVAEVIGWNLKKYRVIQCNTCHKRWLIKIT